MRTYSFGTDRAWRNRPTGAEPFPDGDRVKLLNCPACRNKGVLYYFVPQRRAYKTRCIKCDAVHAIHDNDVNFTELQEEGLRGPSNQLDGLRHPSPLNPESRDVPNVDLVELDASDWIWEKVEREDDRRWWKR